MALLVKPTGEAVVENSATTGVAANSGNSEQAAVKTTTAASTNTDSGKIDTSSVPKNVTAGMSFEQVKAGLGEGYDSRFDEQIADLYNQIVGRKAFAYNPSEDAMFKNYEQLYTRKGKEAMRDTMGQAAALTGGYGNSYGQAVGQQTYDSFMQELTALLPELEQAALQKYNQEGDRLTQQYGLLTDLENRDYSRWQGDQAQLEGLYKMFMDEAAILGAAGDFSKYGEMFGSDTLDKMELLFNAQTLMPLYEAGYIDPEKYKQITGEYPVGYVPPGSAASGGSGGDWGYNDGGYYDATHGYLFGSSGDFATDQQAVYNAYH